MHYVYLLKSSKRSRIYIGTTDDLRTRFAQHQAGRVKLIKAYLPFKLIYYEAYASKTDARKREIELKSHNQKKELLFKQLTSSLSEI